MCSFPNCRSLICPSLWSCRSRPSLSSRSRRSRPSLYRPSHHGLHRSSLWRRRSRRLHPSLTRCLLRSGRRCRSRSCPCHRSYSCRRGCPWHRSYSCRRSFRRRHRHCPIGRAPELSLPLLPLLPILVEPDPPLVAPSSPPSVGAAARASVRIIGSRSAAAVVGSRDDSLEGVMRQSHSGPGRSSWIRRGHAAVGGSQGVSGPRQGGVGLRVVGLRAVLRKCDRPRAHRKQQRGDLGCGRPRHELRREAHSRARRPGAGPGEPA